MLELGQYHIGGTTSREIAASAEAAIRDGRLETGERAADRPRARRGAGTSPATVNAAYRILRHRGLVSPTAVAARAWRRVRRCGSEQPARHDPDASLGAATSRSGSPDPALLPPIGPALAGSTSASSRSSLGRRPRPARDRRGLVRGRRRARPERWRSSAAPSTGSSACCRRICAPATGSSSRTRRTPSIRDLLLALGLVAVPVPVDDRGLIPDALEAALLSGAEAAIVVPRAQNPLGSAIDPERAASSAQLLEPHPDLLLVEDDHAGVVAGAPFVSLARRRPRRAGPWSARCRRSCTRTCDWR